MAVPTSGTLSMVKLAREAKYGDYNGGQTMGTISMRDLMEGGNSGGSTISYPAINTASTLHPLDATYTNITNIKVNMGGEAPGSCNTNLIMYNSSNLSSARTCFVRSDLDGTGKTASDYSRQYSWMEIRLNASIGGGVLEHKFERLAKVHTFNGHIYYSNNTGTTRIPNGTYYITFAGANSNGLYTCTGPGNESLKIKVVITNTTTTQTNELGN